MSKQIRQITVFISCPDDVKKQKDIVRAVCESLTKTTTGLEIKAIDWQKNVIPDITGQGAQAIINEQIGKYDYDIYIGIFWKRFGEKQLNGLTPTEEEFEDALDRQRRTQRPKMTVYFKTTAYHPSNLHDAQQSLQIETFKERAKELGVYGSFKTNIEFQRNLFERISSYVNQLSREQPTEAITISKISYPTKKYYIPRKACLSKDYSSNQLLWTHNSAQELFHYISTRKRIVLIGDSGTGKTNELESLAATLSEKTTPYFPFLVRLNQYVNQALIDLIPSSMKQLPEKQWIIILDGFDEIEDKNRNDAIRQIESFSDSHENCNIVISCRTNFYRTETEELPGTLRSFTSCVLLPLDWKQIEVYIADSLQLRARDFEEEIGASGLWDFLKIPFYLVRLVELFKDNGSFPKNRAEIFEQLLKARFNLDITHFQETLDLDEKETEILRSLERVALSMETLGRNFITDEELQKLISKEEQKLIKHCTAWKKNQDETTIWQFEHNNFQEYLAARILSRQSVEIIKQFIAFKPDFKKVVPSWVNTLSFLLSISKDPGLYKWIMHDEPELIVKAEADRVPVGTRAKVFKSIFNKYKEKQIWIDHERFKYLELARFGQSDEIVRFLLHEAGNDSHYTTVCNAIQLLSKMKLPHQYVDRTSRLLVKLATNTNAGTQVQNRSMIALGELKLYSHELVGQIVKVLASSSDDWIRYGLYYYLSEGPCLDDNIDVFLNGIKYIRSSFSSKKQEVRLSDESWYLRVGLERAKTPAAIKKILSYFTKHPEDVHSFSFEEGLSTLAKNAAQAYESDVTVLEPFYDLFAKLARGNYDEAATLTAFFDATSTRFEIFQKIFLKENRDQFDAMMLGMLADKHCADFVIIRYEEKTMTDDEIQEFQYELKLWNPALFATFNETINKKSGDKFMLPPERHIQKERKDRIQKDIELLFDKGLFIGELTTIFTHENKAFLTNNELIKLQTEYWDNKWFSDLALNTLKQITRTKEISLDDAVKLVNDWDWDLFCVSKLYNYYTGSKDIVLSKEQEEWVAHWCFRNLKMVNYKTALVSKTNIEYSTSWLAVYLWYFLQKFNLSYPKETLLDMLLFYWHEEGTLGMRYLEEHLDESDMTASILANLANGITNEHVLTNHLDYVLRHHLKEAASVVVNLLTDKARQFDTRKLALEILFQWPEFIPKIEEILLRIEGQLRWVIVEGLIERKSKYVKGYLVDLVNGKDEGEKYEAARYLIQMEELIGLKAYVAWIRRENRLPSDSFGKSPLLSLRTMKALPFLIELLEISFKKGFIQDDFHRLDRLVLDTLTIIALESEDNYLKIRSAIERFIEKNSKKHKNVNFLHVSLDRLEQKYYITRSAALDIDETVRRIKSV